MKKTYLSPTTTTVHVDTIIMNGASLGVYSDGVNSESDLLGRGRNYDLWDDEEDE